jgi:hypothetical protein
MKTVRSSQPMRHVEKRKQVVPLEKRPPQDGGATTHLRPVKRSRRPYVTHLTGLHLDQSNILGAFLVDLDELCNTAIEGS